MNARNALDLLMILVKALQSAPYVLQVQFRYLEARIDVKHVPQDVMLLKVIVVAIHVKLVQLQEPRAQSVLYVKLVLMLR